MGYNFGPLQTINKYLDEIIHSINGFQKSIRRLDHQMASQSDIGIDTNHDFR